MSLSIYTHDTDSTDFKNTQLYGSCNFTIKFGADQEYKQLSRWPAINGQWIDTVTGICDETNGINYSITWDNGPGATLVSKIKDFTQAEAFKMFSGKAFDPNPATGQWTQQYPKEGSGLSVTLKFRAYKQPDFANTTSYMTLIQWLTFMTSPLHDFSINEEIVNIQDALGNAKRVGEDVGNELNSLVDNNRLNFNNFDSIMEKFRLFQTNLKQLATQSRGHITCMLQVGDIIKMSPNVDWIIDSWSFTPSNFMGEPNKNDYQYGMPIYCDFEISMSTNKKLSNNLLQSIIK